MGNVIKLTRASNLDWKKVVLKKGTIALDILSGERIIGNLEEWDSTKIKVFTKKYKRTINIEKDLIVRLVQIA